MPKVKPQYIIGHWTAGNYQPNYVDMEAYDLLITGEGLKVIGNHELDNNKASTAGMNSITYNISCCGGLNRTPLTKVQCEAFFKAVAEKLKQFNLTVDKFYTHTEIGQMVSNGTIIKLLPNNSYLKDNKGKIDLTKLPYDLNGKSSGDFIRNKIQWYYERI